MIWLIKIESTLLVQFTNNVGKYNLKCPEYSQESFSTLSMPTRFLSAVLFPHLYPT